jgi:hypothetical protein
MENFLKNFPPVEELLRTHVPAGLVYEVNGHIHTPYSFSAFSGVNPIFEMAMKEDIKVLGINDFYTTGGYLEFHDNALENWVFPLFNIEFIALDRDKQKRGIRVNDPSNPGRTYFSGKGLDFPDSLDAERTAIVESVKAESLRQVRTMIDKANDLFDGLESGIHLTFEDIRKEYARDQVRERHIAKAIRIAVYSKFGSMAERKSFLTALYSGREQVADPENHAAVEIEIRNNLLKAGGKAFVEEDEKAFLSVDAVIDIITHAGGIPCYPVLLDDAKGIITDYEQNREGLWSDLMAKGIFCIELIPGRNDRDTLENFVKFFQSKGFIITFGTEHNTPDLVPLTISCRGRVPLPETLRKLSFEGACILAAHQYLRAQGHQSPVSRWSELDAEGKDNILTLGKAVVYHFTNSGL